MRRLDLKDLRIVWILRIPNEMSGNILSSEIPPPCRRVHHAWVCTIMAGHTCTWLMLRKPRVLGPSSWCQGIESHDSSEYINILNEIIRDHGAIFEASKVDRDQVCQSNQADKPLGI